MLHHSFGRKCTNVPCSFRYHWIFLKISIRCSFRIRRRPAWCKFHFLIDWLRPVVKLCICLFSKGTNAKIFKFTQTNSDWLKNFFLQVVICFLLRPQFLFFILVELWNLPFLFFLLIFVVWFTDKPLQSIHATKFLLYYISIFLLKVK